MSEGVNAGPALAEPQSEARAGQATRNLGPLPSQHFRMLRHRRRHPCGTELPPPTKGLVKPTAEVIPPATGFRHRERSTLYSPTAVLQGQVDRSRST